MWRIKRRNISLPINKQTKVEYVILIWPPSIFVFWCFNIENILWLWFFNPDFQKSIKKSVNVFDTRLKQFWKAKRLNFYRIFISNCFDRYVILQKNAKKVKLLLDDCIFLFFAFHRFTRFGVSLWNILQSKPQGVTQKQSCLPPRLCLCHCVTR